MDSNPVIVRPEDPAAGALGRMLARGATHAVVADGARVVGVLAITDLMGAADAAGDLRTTTWRS